MKKFWIIGHPLSFCLTTPVMNGAFKEMDFDGNFETHDLPPEDLPKVMEKLRNGELSGVVATMPFKTPSLEYLDEASEEVKAVNAVNVILGEHSMKSSGLKKLHGYNTDWLGAKGAIEMVMPDLTGKKALILGAGGAARAAAYALKKGGAHVDTWNRTPEKGKAFAEKMGLHYVEHLDSWGEEPDVIVNATASSDQSRQSTLIPYRMWQRVQLALDAVYGKTSLFLEEAKASNVPYVISGEMWFLKQVVPLFELITGKKAPVELMARLTAEAQEIQRT